MKRTSILPLLISLAMACPSTFAWSWSQEPANLAEAKRDVITYHDSGKYNEEIREVLEDATAYLKKRLADPASFEGKKPAIVLDVDETSLSNYAILAQHGFGGTKNELLTAVSRATNPAIAPTLQLYKLARTHHVTVFFISARSDKLRTITKNNLKRAGFEDWNKLYLRHANPKSESVEAYKTAARKEITEQGYDIMLNIGDQPTDLSGGYADKTFKIPNPFYS